MGPKHAAIPAPSRLRREPPPTWGLGQKQGPWLPDRHSRAGGDPVTPGSVPNLENPAPINLTASPPAPTHPPATPTPNVANPLAPTTPRNTTGHERMNRH